MIVSEIDPKTGYSDPDEEVFVVSDSIENTGLDPLSERITKMTTLTASNFIQATESTSIAGVELVTDENGSVIGTASVTAESTAATAQSTAATQQTHPTAPTALPDDNGGSEPPQPGSVPTGGVLYALISLAVITISSLILFVMRKKEIMY
jgi:hypothetical protein